MQNKTALVVGATGVVGREIARQLCKHNNYKKVVVWVRREYDFSHEKLEAKVINFDEILAQPHEKFDEIFCALGTTMAQAKSRENFLKVDFEYVKNLATWAIQNSVQKFILISAPHADENSKNFYLQTKGKVQNALKNINFKTLLICQPPLIDGKRKDVRIFERLAIWVFKFLPKKWLSNYRPLSGENIAKAVIYVAQSSQCDEKIFRPQDIKLSV